MLAVAAVVVVGLLLLLRLLPSSSLLLVVVVVVAVVVVVVVAVGVSAASHGVGCVDFRPACIRRTSSVNLLEQDTIRVLSPRLSCDKNAESRTPWAAYTNKICNNPATTNDTPFALADAPTIAVVVAAAVAVSVSFVS